MGLVEIYGLLIIHRCHFVNGWCDLQERTMPLSVNPGSSSAIERENYDLPSVKHIIRQSRLADVIGVLFLILGFLLQAIAALHGYQAFLEFRNLN